MAFIINGGTSETTLRAAGGDIHLGLATPVLRGTATEVILPAALEVQHHEEGLITGQSGAFRVFASVQPRKGHDLRQLGYTAYGRILSHFAGCHILRIWNHLPAINDSVNGLENYQAFCIGRAEAFDRHHTNENSVSYPAGSALGIDDDTLVVFGIAVAAGVATRYFENPQQVPAYRYPPRYGPRPPSFCRAASSDIRHPSNSSIYISGTSSVIQSETEHPFDLPGQLSTTHSVLESLIHAIKQAETPELRLPQALAAAEFRLYLRNPSAADTAANWMAAHFPLNEDNWRVVKADICRRELLAELEISIHPGRLHTYE